MGQEDEVNKSQNLVSMNLIVKRIEVELDQLKNLIKLEMGLTASNCDGNVDEASASIEDDSYCPMDILKIEDDQISTPDIEDVVNNYQDEFNGQDRRYNNDKLLLGMNFNFEISSKEDEVYQNPPPPSESSFFTLENFEDIQEEAQNKIFNRVGKNYICRWCSKKFGSKQILQRHEEVHSLDLTYKCQFCEKKYSAVNNLRVHVHRTHQVKRTNYGKEPNKLLGPSRQALYKSKKLKMKKLKVSKEAVESNSTGQVEIESTDLASSLNLNVEKVTILPEETSQEAGPSSTSSIEVSISEDKNKNEELSSLLDSKTLKCKVCFKTFASKQILQRHEEVHSLDLAYKCQFCANKSFRTINNLRVHVHRSHRSERIDLPFKCGDCSSTFSCESALENHRIESHIGISCVLCSEQFNKRDYLYKHIQNIHFVCPISGCMIQFTSKIELLQHKKEFHSKSKT